MQIESGAGISKNENKKRRKKRLGKRAFGNKGSSPGRAPVLSLHLQCPHSPSFSLELEIELGLSQNHLDQPLGENMDSRHPPTPQPPCSANCWRETPALRMG